VPEKTLLERVDGGDPDVERRSRVNAQDAVDSVVAHLGRLLNVRRGSVPTLPDYGMPDFNDLVFEDGRIVNAVRAAIVDVVTKYEPRLTRLSVTYVPDEDNVLDLRFRITATLVLEGNRAPVTFDTLIGDKGQVKVRG
jgi:type VI secretion system protein